MTRALRLVVIVAFVFAVASLGHARAAVQTACEYVDFPTQRCIDHFCEVNFGHCIWADVELCLCQLGE